MGTRSNIEIITITSALNRKAFRYNIKCLILYAYFTHLIVIGQIYAVLKCLSGPKCFYFKEATVQLAQVSIQGVNGDL